MQQEISLEEKHQALIRRKQILVNRFDVLQGLLSDTTNDIADISARLGVVEQEMNTEPLKVEKEEEETKDGGTTTDSS